MLETQRLILDVWQGDDWRALRPLATDVDVMRHISGGVPWDDERIQNFAERQMKLHEERGFCRWKLLLKPGSEMIGFCGVGIWQEGYPPEIGWWLAKRFWGQGLATEAARVALADAFERVGLERVISIARCANAASIHVMNKLGLRLERVFAHDGVELVMYVIERNQNNVYTE